MQLDRLTVHLRQRTSWEAMELGTALVRRNAAAIWKPWLLMTGSVLVVLNVLGGITDTVWLAGLLMWWLKPVFDRIPLYVISRGVFGDVPTVRQTLRGHLGWGWRAMPGYLLWRRLSPARTLFMPVDLLEGGKAPQRRQRRRMLGGAVYGQMLLLTTIFLHFEWLLTFACLAMAALFVPAEYMPRAARLAWALLSEMPLWVAIGLNVIAWIACTVLEPFYVGAGFGLYLNRRTELEAWDVELTFRKLRRRLTAAATPFALILALCWMWMPSHPASAQTEAPQAYAAPLGTPSDDKKRDLEEAERSAAAEQEQNDTLRDVFGTQRQDPAEFQQAVERTFTEDPLLGGKRTVTAWERRNPSREEKRSPFDGIPGLEGLMEMFSFLAKWGLWILLGIVVVIVLILMPRWLPWLRGTGKRVKVGESEIQHETILPPEKLPDDIVGAARRLWAEGKPRHALALLYRASVETMATRAQVILPPGATEVQCLRASQRMPDAADRDLFVRVVRVWQYAAYAWRLPEAEVFDRLLDELQQRYQWGRA